MTGAEAVQAVADMSRERERDFDTYAMGWVLGAAREGEPWAVEFLAQVVPSFNATVPATHRHEP